MSTSSGIELEIFRQLLVSIAEEMGVVLRKTAYSANIKERRDYSCALYDSSGAAIAMGDHMPVHLGAMPLSVLHAIQAFALAPGDVVILNDPFAGGTHLPDITAVSAVFLDEQPDPAFYLANRAHHADVGGMSPGSMPLAREIYQEGLRIPPVLIRRAGEIDEPLMRLVLANVRTPEERKGDLLAQFMAIQRGESRIREVVSKYGLSVVQRNTRLLQDYSERFMRAAIQELPDGEYKFEDLLDDDGMTQDAVKIRVSIRIEGDQAEVDFNGSDPQRSGPINANYAITLAATVYVFRCLLQEDVPFTAGLLRPIKVVAPEGSVVNARAPAAMAGGNVETSQRITDVLLGALAQAAPKKIPAASSGTMTNVSFGGWDSARERPFTYYETIAGGMGAGPRYPGQDAVHTHMTNSWNTPVEALEHQYPVRVRRYAIRRGSGGGGVRKGGDGLVREIEFLAPASVTLISDRSKKGPYGLVGGESGLPGSVILLRNGRPLSVPSKSSFEVVAGDILHVETPGGGGHGRKRKNQRRSLGGIA